jgi:hypothetical protein
MHAGPAPESECTDSGVRCRRQPRRQPGRSPLHRVPRAEIRRSGV